MSTEIQKYVNTYLITFKWEQEPLEIWADAWKQLIQDINSLSFVTIWGNSYNKFEILKIEKRKSSKEIWDLLHRENSYIQENVKKEMRIYKKEITVNVLKNMIAKYKN